MISLIKFYSNCMRLVNGNRLPSNFFFLFCWQNIYVKRIIILSISFFTEESLIISIHWFQNFSTLPSFWVAPEATAPTDWIIRIIISSSLTSINYNKLNFVFMRNNDFYRSKIYWVENRICSWVCTSRFMNFFI